MTRCLLLVFGILFSACFGYHEHETVWSARRSVRYDGAGCERAVYTLKEAAERHASYDRSNSTEPAVQLLLAVCPRWTGSTPAWQETDRIAIETHPRVTYLDVVKLYLHADDRALPVLEAAIATVQAANDAAGGERYADVSGARLSAALFFARVLPRAEVAAAVARVPVAPKAREAFMTLYGDAAMRLAARMTPDQTELWVNRAVAVYEERRAHFQKFAEAYGKLDALTAKAKAARDDKQQLDGLVAELERLRSSFLAACGKLECHNLPLYAWATRELAQLHALRGDAASAHAESAVFAKRGSWVADLAPAVLVAQHVELEKLEASWKKYETARRTTDERTARSLAPDAPAHEPPPLVLQPEMALEDYGRALGSYLRDETGEVASVGGGGKDRVVYFKKQVTRGEEAYNCVQTNRVTQINRDGTLVYDEICQYRPYTDVKDTHAPITIPAADAVGVRPGDTVLFATAGKVSRVISVTRGKAIVQLRSDLVPRS